MAAVKTISRGMKIATLPPLTVASCLATTSILIAANTHHPAALAQAIPGHQVMPAPATPLQATATRAGWMAPALAVDAVDAVSISSVVDIPAVAVAAYQHAAQIINASDPTCHMPWQLIGAIGRVESNNGQFHGSHLTSKGEAVPGIYGPVLDGKNGVGLIRDTDGGALDHNATYDRAVGPMQFLPSTWAVVGVDATGNGKRDPQNIYDAALGTAVYLCFGGSNMSNTSDIRAAVFRYNHSDTYVDLVMNVMKAYEAGNFSPTPTEPFIGAAEPTPHTNLKMRSPRASSRTGRPPVAAHKPTQSTLTSPPSTAPSAPTPTPSAGANPLQGLINGLLGNR